MLVRTEPRPVTCAPSFRGPKHATTRLTQGGRGRACRCRALPDGAERRTWSSKRAGARRWRRHRAMGLDGVSKSRVSRLCAEIDGRVGGFLARPVEGDWPYPWLDATYVKVREAGRIIPVAV